MNLLKILFGHSHLQKLFSTQLLISINLQDLMSEFLETIALTKRKKKSGKVELKET